VLTDKALCERRWGKFPVLRLAIENRTLSGHHYGWTSVDDNIFQKLPRVLEIGFLALESRGQIREVASTEGWGGMHRDVELLSNELRALGELLKQVARDVESLHREQD